MTDEIKRLRQKHRGRPVIIDTNLLLLLIVGTINISYIETFKRLKSHFSQDDFVIFLDLIKAFPTIVTTTSILTETSNLLNQLNYSQKFSAFYKALNELKEIHLNSDELNQECFAKYGLTDSAIFTLATRENLLVITIDLDLYIFLVTHGVDAINFNHLRPFD